MRLCHRWLRMAAHCVAVLSSTRSGVSSHVDMHGQGMRAPGRGGRALEQHAAASDLLRLWRGRRMGFVREALNRGSMRERGKHTDGIGDERGRPQKDGCSAQHYPQWSSTTPRSYYSARDAASHVPACHTPHRPPLSGRHRARTPPATGPYNLRPFTCTRPRRANPVNRPS